jgi:hypothetical protein
MYVFLFFSVEFGLYPPCFFCVEMFLLGGMFIGPADGLMVTRVFWGVLVKNAWFP